MSRLRFCLRPRRREQPRALQPRPRPLDLPRRRPEPPPRIEAALADFVPLPERFPGQFHRLHAALTTGGPLPVTLADARRSIELLTAAYCSAATGEPVTLPLPPDHPYYAGWVAARTGGRAWLSSSSAQVVKRFGAVEVIHGVDLAHPATASSSSSSAPRAAASRRCSG